MRTTLAIIEASGFDDCTGLGQIIEAVRVEAFIAQRSIEGFDEGIVGRFAVLREVDAYAVMISP